MCLCLSTPWLMCGFRKHQRWTRVSSITAAHSWATCSTSETWCWGEYEVIGDADQLYMLCHPCFSAGQVWLCQFQHQWWVPEQDEPSPCPWCGKSPGLCCVDEHWPLVESDSTDWLDHTYNEKLHIPLIASHLNWAVCRQSVVMFYCLQPWMFGLLKVLIKKSYDRTRRVKRRNWKLQEMARDRDGMDTDDER